MKITKITKISDSQFADEGKDIIEQTPEKEQFETLQAQQELDDQALGKKGQTHTAEVLSLAIKPIGNIINASYVAGGSVGWVKHTDGIIYEILVQPAALGTYFHYLQELQKTKQEK